MEPESFKEQILKLSNKLMQLENKIYVVEADATTLPTIVSTNPNINIYTDTYNNEIKIDSNLIDTQMIMLTDKVKELEKENGVLANYILTHIKNK